MKYLVMWHPENVSSKSQLLQAVAQELSTHGAISSTQALIDAIEQREQLGDTSLSEQLAIPHAQCEAVLEACIIFVATPAPIEDWKQASRFVFTALPLQADAHDLTKIKDFFLHLADDRFVQELSVADEHRIRELLT